MFPGFTRTAAQPASIAAKTYFGWKWMSAITGICDFLAIAGSASASSCEGQATRTIWQPDAVSSAICCSVAPMSDGTGRRHRLHRDRRVTAHGDRSDLDLPADPAVGELGRNGRHSERNRSHLLCNPKVWIEVPEIGGLRAPRLRHRLAPEHIPSR